LHSVSQSAILHYVTESATASRATERKQATAARLTQLCRTLTAERGLNGFTIEEVCGEVGISRRTFFNYFPSKEEAVFGVDESDELRRFSGDFLALGSRGWPAVVDDLVRFIADYVRDTGHDMTEHTQFMTMLEREPKLLARFVGLGREREAQLLELVALREGVATGDPLARASVDLFTTIMRSTADRLSDPRVAADFGAALLDSLTALREVLAPGKASS
jgi:AcrR family transcriptional regulator